MVKVRGSLDASLNQTIYVTVDHIPVDADHVITMVFYTSSVDSHGWFIQLFPENKAGKM